jgi:predicted RNA-binding Zn-ribbon protein involved in translation (DUF1610 family)
MTVRPANRMATPSTRRPGRPTSDTVAARPPEVQTQITAQGSLVCPQCGSALVTYGSRNKDGSVPYRCCKCGSRWSRTMVATLRQTS